MSTKKGSQVQICVQGHNLPEVKENVGQTPEYLENTLCCHVAITHLVSTALLEENGYFIYCMKTLFLTDMVRNLPEASFSHVCVCIFFFA